MRREEEQKQAKHNEEVKQNFKKAAMEMTAKISKEHRKIATFINEFYSIYDRNPLPDEIRENFENTMEGDILTKFLDGYSAEEIV
jgi:sulfur relay (sulfurtransferase) DsrC/TusE family protein